MSFKIDRQTLEELNLLGKFRQGSVYHLFNQVKTRGGEQLLDEMFRNPLTNAEQINQRSSILRFFQQQALAFPFDVQQINLMREYIDTSSGKSAAMVLFSTVVKKTLASLTRDERYKKNIQGLQATIVTIKKTVAIVELLCNLGGPFAASVEEIRKILAQPQLQKLADTDIYQDLPLKTLAFYEYLLKNRMQKEMEAVLSFIYQLDLNMAVSNVAAVKGFNYATALAPEKNILAVNDLRHPCIDKAIGNNLVLKENSNVLFLTGANMAGKSTLMKSLGIGLYLAHMGFPVAAARFDFSVREGLYSSINVADNIGLGYSHFYAEVVRVKQAAEAAASGQRLMLMFDELFKGTNVKDAYDGTLSVTEAFAEYADCLFVVSTHIIEVGEALKATPNIQFRFLPTIMEGSRPKYTYRLEQGITEDRQGMMIIRNEGILEMIGSGNVLVTDE
ncbi:MutS-related protein [Pseudobacter ginsenosidimutans]|uniref:MutS-like protein n=1 Tax=Pseudobacter ginsenosidimutans TaxID=661488 RepID=A0A4V2F075_9BACT|nr:DNA mismatch repair protein [Pseudobacter ginsenosidimutans]QEC40385.1 DNA mismatch repair protein [Pseudobacter ginsenosidimutans]RZS69010.1 MutS-like protein [Pseudobacter ginsenosidimutans]